ncbi:hypothetical protein LTR56_025042 [Elasticomyces elasticus]|nr:hypothetical protein LTR56_025042 [Elasticomyces elasticus]KAK3621179.1 hypothetical protein LTR22_025309 [Elasticomyces elasticus]KAK4905039.1 hypothetical protein LTR49_025616 [Elasticomyces elasticus]KAK5755701.1 hypothetical protein LTS12_014163 [Elasticomyces elasticus]
MPDLEPVADCAEPSSGPQGSANTPGSHHVSFAQGPKSWTDSIPKTAHNSLFLNYDWSSTTLGPIDEWGPALRLYASMIFADSRGAVLWWGHDRVAFYNEEYVANLGGIHPYLMGRSFHKAFPEVAHSILPKLDQAVATGRTVNQDDQALYLERHGYIEESYFHGQFIPVRGDSGEIEGIYNSVQESTARVLLERRRQLVNRLAAIPTLPIGETLPRLIEALRSNPWDVPIALLYSFDELSSEVSSNLRLRGSIGIPEGHRCAPLEANLETAQDGLVPYFRQAKLTGKPHVLRRSDGSLQKCEHLFDEVEWCGFGEPSQHIVIYPLQIGGTVLGFYVQGTNPRRPYDDATRASIADLVRQMEVTWINAITTQQAQLREQMLENRATESENRLRHMAQYAPVGMVQTGLDHKIQWANDQFYEITGHDRSRPELSEFMNVLAEEERGPTIALVEDLFNGGPRVVKEIRLNRAWAPPVKDDVGEGDVCSAWMLVVTFRLMENGKLKLIMGYILDISQQKWAETVQRRNAAAATLAKRRQEEFIDSTSHEMRNPLSAITQLADGIANSLLHVTEEDKPEIWRSAARESVAAATTILACAAHQKRVIDDVLILSRLESQMLSISPVVAQPSRVVSDTIKMFRGEISVNGIEIEATRDDIYGIWKADWVLMDTSRLTQVLINLISNGIKFTASRPTRKISVLYGQQAQRPPHLKTIFGDLEWIPSRHPETPNVALPDLAEDEEKVYVYFCVQDTGPGLTEEQMDRLFQRFSQATSKTHITYGGSGLGLYISRELAEKQGGGVGVASKPDEGSVFAFYIETRAANPPEHVPAERPIFTSSSSKDANHDLPRRTPSNPEIANGSASSEHKKSPPDAVHQQNGFHILLVEDNEVNQKVLARQLQKAKCTVSVANHGIEALEVLDSATCRRRSHANTSSAGDHAHSRQIEVILMDVEMPEMDGLQCTRRIRELESEGKITRHLPVIATTANVRQEQKDEALSAGVDSVLSKPFTVSEVLAKIREVIALVERNKGAIA